VHDILAEMQPIKEQLIQKITNIIKKTIPNSEVKVYGSHATKLCLPWSDIDLVLIPPKNDGGVVYNAKSVLS
jgi:DNA polymerase sigma